MAAFPFFFQGPRNDETKPPTDVNVLTVDIGGPIFRDRTHFFGGYEHTERDLSSTAVITITPANQAALGLSEPQYQPQGAQHRVRHRQARSPVQRQQPRCRCATSSSTTSSPPTSAAASARCSGPPTSPTASTRRRLQFISTIRTNLLNELRVQYATRAQGRVPAGLAGTGPAINVTNVANFGGPIASLTDAGFGFTQDVGQFNNSLTYSVGRPRAQGRLRHPARRPTPAPARRSSSTPSRPRPPTSRPPAA